MSLREPGLNRADVPQNNPITEATLTSLFQELHIGRVGEPKMSDPTSMLSPMDAVRMRRLSTRKPMMDAPDEAVLLTLLQERSEPLTPTQFANVIAGWAQVYGWHFVEQD